MVELIPVIEIWNYHSDIPVGNNGPFWEYSDDWDLYYATCFSLAGFKDPIPTYLPGSAFCRLHDISDNNLTKLVKDHTRDMLEGNYPIDEASPFSGGYVLRIDGLDRYFPQCCGDLSDIQYWKDLANGNASMVYPGHPCPGYEINEDQITFDFTEGEFDERFSPPVLETHLNVKRADLAYAISEALKQLGAFAKRLATINITEQLDIADIANLLVCGDQDYY